MFEINPIHAELAVGSLSPETKIILFCGRDVLLSAVSRDFLSPAEAAPYLADTALYRIGTLNGVLCAGAERMELPSVLPAGVIRMPSRFVLAESPGDNWQALCRTRELVFWLNRHRFCGKCGEKMQPSGTDSAMICPVCRTHYYPQIAPAVIVAITRNGGREILLAHNRNFEPGVHSLIAGFVETGETAEQAVGREIREETSLSVKDVRYLASQTWPFPNSLMLAFRAEYDSGTAAPDGVELDSLGWFTKDSLPALPRPGSIAAAVIAGWLRETV